MELLGIVNLGIKKYFFFEWQLFCYDTIRLSGYGKKIKSIMDASAKSNGNIFADCDFFFDCRIFLSWD
jgi:hypothetical protein